MSKLCPACAEKTLHASGDSMSDILFIASVPGDDEIKFSTPFVGYNGKIFKSILFKRTGIDLLQTRYVYLWYHAKKSSKKAQDCFAVSLSQVMNEFIYKKKIILIGAEAVRHFTGMAVDSVNGMDVTDQIEDAGDVRYFAMVNPNTVFKSVGEIYYAMDKLKEWLNAN
jgi:uracil-DNA glycosylase